ncbi:hypothetical protein [Amycolatopsis magusensis]|uniref:hypothetical protein n=1 Tax=Amycolatopsis magusensis TaxID=882444 RepID=UPI0024A7C58F|nr:hypothetical protein [Amycolatopsis magusensis]MDI5979877.1 hypothetical protein [Amycolatopsis magusensis]
MSAGFAASSKRHWRRFTASASVVAMAGAALLAQAPAAGAAGQLSGSCLDVWVHQNKLSGSAWYTTPSAGVHHWTGTSFRADGALGNESNISIQLFAGGREIVRRGADNIAGNYTYTSTAHPKFALNADTAAYHADEHVGFWIKFDIPLADDDKFWCSFVTRNI